MKQLLSYIIPSKKTITSKYSGTLEIVWCNGKKHLNSKNAIYSYGALQRILKFGIEKINLNRVNSVLVLGMGGGSVIKTLRNDFKFTKSIEAVEIDSVIIDIATTEFGVSQNDLLNIHCQDAFHFVKNNIKKFDLVIVDIYIDLSVPDQFLSVEFWKNVLSCKSLKGSIIFNASVQNTKINKVKAVIEFLKTKVFTVDVYPNVNGTNTIIIARGL
ncbi:spermidine synthase [Winogradskyella sp. PE311]|uniref:spermidine synthase n=1 Tax=Winogradskyella sp. PE311 TaxID=3366943 RepID=UPI0039802194